MAVDPTNPLAQKSRRGLSRILHATGYSMSGLRLGMQEPAFRQEALLALMLIPAAFFLGRQVLEVLVLIGTVFLVLITELLNTAVEAAIDRVGTDYHDLSKRAKDLGSAAVFLSLVLCGLTWCMIAFSRMMT
jgi:diacylglycerol kinase (ATP)